MAFLDKSKANYAFKSLLGKAHTSNGRELSNEAISSGIILSASRIFADSINSTPNHSENSGIVSDLITLVLEAVAGSDTQVLGTYQAYRTKLGGSVPTSLVGKINPLTKAAYAPNDYVGNLIPQSFGDSFRPILYSDAAATVEIPPSSAADWFIDCFAGIVVQEGYDDGSAFILGANGRVKAYVYTGRFVSDALISSGGGGSISSEWLDSVRGFSQDLIGGTNAFFNFYEDLALTTQIDSSLLLNGLRWIHVGSTVNSLNIYNPTTNQFSSGSISNNDVVEYYISQGTSGTIGYIKTTPTAGTFTSFDENVGAIYRYTGSTWVTEDFGSTASNGLTKTGNDIQLGGALTQNTDITGAFDLNIGVFGDSLSNFTVEGDISGRRSRIGLSDGGGYSYIRNDDAGFTQSGQVKVGIDYVYLYAADGANTSTIDIQDTGIDITTDFVQFNLTDGLTVNDTSNGGVYLKSQGIVELNSGFDTVRLSISDADNGTLFRDNRTVASGIEYFADYSSNYTNRSLVDKEFVITQIGYASTAAVIIPGEGLGFDSLGHISLGSPSYGSATAITTDRYVKLDPNGRVIFADSLGGSALIVLDDSVGSGIQIQASDIAGGVDYFSLSLDYSNGAIFTDARPTKTGIEYAADYSTDYTNRTLVDKEFVITQIGYASTAANVTASNGLSKSGPDVILGGALTQNTDITGNDIYDLRLGVNAGSDKLSAFEVNTVNDINLNSANLTLNAASDVLISANIGAGELDIQSANLTANFNNFTASINAGSHSIDLDTTTGITLDADTSPINLVSENLNAASNTFTASVNAGSMYMQVDDTIGITLEADTMPIILSSTNLNAASNTFTASVNAGLLYMQVDDGIGITLEADTSPIILSSTNLNSSTTNFTYTTGTKNLIVDDTNGIELDADISNIIITSTNLTANATNFTAFGGSGYIEINAADPIDINGPDGIELNANANLLTITSSRINATSQDITLFNGLGGGLDINDTSNYVKLSYDNINGLDITNTGINVTLTAGNTFAYAADYSLDFTDRSLVDKAYVDAVAQGLDPKASVRVATTGFITLSGLQTIDGVTLIAGDRVLVKDQGTAGQDNGIYVADSGAWTRSTDFDGTPAAEVTAGAYTFVEEGTSLQDTGWVLSTNDPITLGTTSLYFVQFSAAGQFTASNGLTKTGNNVTLGGLLTQNTTIDGNSSYNLVLDNLSEFSIDSGVVTLVNSLTSAGTAGYDIVVRNSATGVLEKVTSAVLTGSVPTLVDKNLTPSAGTNGNAVPTSLTITYTPSADSYVDVKINGISVYLGTASGVGEAYFAAPGSNGATGRALANIQAGDEFFWNATVAGYYLDNLDRVDFLYNVV